MALYPGDQQVSEWDRTGHYEGASHRHVESQGKDTDSYTGQEPFRGAAKRLRIHEQKDGRRKEQVPIQ